MFEGLRFGVRLVFLFVFGYRALIFLLRSSLFFSGRGSLGGFRFGVKEGVLIFLGILIVEFLVEEFEVMWVWDFSDTVFFGFS